MPKAQRDIRRKRQVLDYAQQIDNTRKACRYFGIGRSSFYHSAFAGKSPYEALRERLQ